ncbi:hypothetical protein BGX34_010190, partial [Mortierella sp. NVP85]
PWIATSIKRNGIFRNQKSRQPWYLACENINIKSSAMDATTSAVITSCSAEERDRSPVQHFCVGDLMIEKEHNENLKKHSVPISKSSNKASGLKSARYLHLRRR